MTHPSETIDLPFLDITAPGFATCSDAVQQARRQAWCARTPFGIAVLRHRQGGQLLRDRRLRQGSYGWPDIVGLTGPFADFWKRSVISQEGPHHKALRRIAQAALAEPHILALEPEFTKIMNALCDGLPASGFDMVDDVTEPFAGRAIATLLGKPAEDAPQIAHDASRLGLAMGLDARQHQETTNQACERLSSMADALLSAPPNNSFVARLLEVSDGIDRQALIDLVVIAIFGGVDTTRAQLAFAAWLFARHPDQWTWLRAHPEAVPQAIDEVIRIRPTTTWATREALEDFTFDNVPIGKGDTLHILVHSTATDPQTGHDGVFDIRRPAKVHFGFGGGAHHCLGHFVARTDMAAALRVMLRRWQSIHLDGTSEFLPDSGNTSPVTLPLRVEAA